MKEDGNLEQNDFANYSFSAKIQLFGLFFFIGVLNHLGTILVMTGGRLLTIELDMKPYVTLYTSVATIFSIITRMVNSKLCLKVSYKKRVIIICFWMIFGYLSMFTVLVLHENALKHYNALCFVLTFIPCFFLGSSYAFGESAMIAYLRLFPKTLIAGWSSGTGVSGMMGGGLNLLTQLLDNFSLKFLYLVLTPVGPLYLFLFLWTFKLLKQDRNSLLSVAGTINEPIIDDKKEKDIDDIEVINDENRDSDMSKKIESLQDERTLNDMNRKNKTMSWENFKEVMRMCGRVIINLGFIYFIQFVCVNSLVIQNSNKIDISFLPKDTNDDGEVVRKGKFEFVNMFYQLGMFTSKTFIKLVRKIQPIEVYTISITSITIIYFIEYYTGFLPWWTFPILNYVLGFFSGGTYAGGFYVILHSGQVLLDYKELTVNVATIFNDSGTFLSGLVGYVLLNFIIDNDDPFDGEKLE